MAGTLTDRWYPLEAHPARFGFFMSPSRFNVVPAGRRSGKTDIAKRRLVLKAFYECQQLDDYFVAAAPTYQQAKRIYWQDLKRLIPKRHIADVSDSELILRIKNGAQILVVGMDKPARIEGVRVRHLLADESADMRPEMWPEHARPALADSNGSADFIGVPAGRNHFWEMAEQARDFIGWKLWHWTAEEIFRLRGMDDEIEALKRELDPQTYSQEMDANFIHFAGRAYYLFEREIHASAPLTYNPEHPLIMTFDFNVDPGVAVVAQEFGANSLPGEPAFTGIIDEVYVPGDSQTPIVMAKLLNRWRKHSGRVQVFGDATGGSRGTAQTQGSNWDLIRAAMFEAYDKRNVYFHVNKSNPPERARLNAMNSRIKAMSGDVHLRVDPGLKHTVRDFEGTRLITGSGEIDKKDDKKLSHITDAIGYYVAQRHPIRRAVVKSTQM